MKFNQTNKGMINLFLWMMILILFGCNANEYDNSNDDIQITKQSIDLAKKYNFQPVGSGGFNRKGLKGHTFMYKYFENVEESTARKLIISFVNDLLQSVNHSRETPLTVNNFDIYIFFYNPGHHSPNLVNEGLAEVRLVDGNIKFAIDRSGTFDLETIHSEPYAEAYEKVTGRKCELQTTEIKSDE